MSNEEIALLKADYDRLNKIISIVVEQNELLKLENAFLKKALTPKDIINSFAKIGIALKDKEIALVKLSEGLRNDTKGIVNFEEGNNNVTEGIVNSNQGNNNSEGDMVSVKEGNNNVTGDMVQVDEANNNVAEVMPAIIDASGNIVDELEKELKASGYNKISHSGVNNAAKLLIHFYNKGDGSYTQLRKITGHSTDGIAKFIMGMKKRGWIHRFGFQQFGLSQQGLDLITRAYKSFDSLRSKTSI